MTTPTKAATDQFHTTRLRLLGLASANRLWERLLKRSERDLLGSSFKDACAQYPSAIEMWMRAKGVRRQTAIIDLGEALGFLTATDADWLRREGGELPRDPVEAELFAEEQGGLVIVRSERVLYWERSICDIDWNDKSASWDFLVKAAERAKQRLPIDRECFGGTSRNVVAQKKNRLGSIPGIPESLMSSFILAGRGTQRLDIPPDQIFLL